MTCHKLLIQEFTMNRKQYISKAVHMVGFFILLSALLPLFVYGAATRSAHANVVPSAHESSRGEGIAARYTNDVGISKDPDIIFTDDFESWKNATEPLKEKWSVRNNKVSRTSIISGSTMIDGSNGPGKGVLEIACWTQGSGSQSGGLSLKLGNYNNTEEGLGYGHDELYIRYYIKFDEEYRAVRNHGANLGGRDLQMENAAWVGMAKIQDVSTRGYFYSGLQPYGKSGSKELEMDSTATTWTRKVCGERTTKYKKKSPLRLGNGTVLSGI